MNESGRRRREQNRHEQYPRRQETPSPKIKVFKTFVTALRATVSRETVPPDGKKLIHGHALEICAKLHDQETYNHLSADPDSDALPWSEAMTALTLGLTKYKLSALSTERAEPLLALLSITPLRFLDMPVPEEEKFPGEDDLLPGDAELPPMVWHASELAFAEQAPPLLSQAELKKLRFDALTEHLREMQDSPVRSSGEGYYDPFDNDREYEDRLRRRVGDPRAEAWELPGWEQGRSLRPGEGMDPPMDDDELLAMIELEDARDNLIEPED